MPESIAKYNEVKTMHPMMQPNKPFKQNMGYREPNMFPKVSIPTGSVYGSTGMNRAQGNCRWYADGYQAPLIRNPGIRLWNPLQSKVVAETLPGQQMYNGNYAGTPHYSKNISL